MGTVSREKTGKPEPMGDTRGKGGTYRRSAPGADRVLDPKVVKTTVRGSPDWLKAKAAEEAKAKSAAAAGGKPNDSGGG